MIYLHLKNQIVVGSWDQKREVKIKKSKTKSNKL